jgi:NAD(P)-dependent dehydrogenase (short-subunit alcohol dehydrogenase family)
MPVGIITGASRGLGFALAQVLADRGWHLVVDARGTDELEQAAAQLGAGVVAIAGDVADPSHREALVKRAGKQIDLVVNNASILGPSPQPELDSYPLDVLDRVYRVNVVAPLGLIQTALPWLGAGARIVNVTSNAGASPFKGWGGYGSSKAALEQLSAVLALERPELRVYAVDPGNMRTRMHQEAYPDRDISDLPPPEKVIPGFMELVDGDHPSGRYVAGDLA